MALKKTSEVLSLPIAITEAGTNTFTQKAVALPLNPLDREVFVVTAIQVNMGVLQDNFSTDSPVSLEYSVTRTSQTTVQGLSNPSTIAAGARRIVSVGSSATYSGAVGFEDGPMDSPPAGLDYLAIIATDDFFIQIQGENAILPLTINGRMWGYRAQADAAVYAALVQSELLG